ncbi:hypothetical protein PGT21_001703 [Puccinia graminis f. sp. tritici]|nr:hypothetical protein PGTUg99_008385 [Puccinia graminis f. sp. tritici]KAA1103823.1 hypothetical protein PGT21_001703 [Puccinia graminis f. sp. tritici]
MSPSNSIKSQAMLLALIRHRSSGFSYPCGQKQFNTHANPVFRPDNAVPSTDAKGFQKRERSEEGRYAREKEVAEIKELRDQLAKHQAKIEQLENHV